MPKPTTLLALTLVAGLFIITTPAIQVVPIPIPAAVQLNKRGAFLGSFAPMLTALRPVTNNIGQGTQAAASGISGASQDLGTTITQQTNRFGNIGEESVAGAGRTIVRAPGDVNKALVAAPL
ncbi:hypothetical protein BGW39_001604 [Mortierella sp. 14UC]|nr:hypothetical protein BGW39_001604 [Mortierella sp. 14UC]